MDRVLAGALLLAIRGAVFQAALPARCGARAGSADALAGAVADALWPSIVAVAIGTVAHLAAGARALAAGAEPRPAELAHHQHHRRFHL